MRAGSFGLEVVARNTRVPQPIDGRPGLYVAMGGDIAGVRFTAAEWASGTYHVVLRFTNGGTTDVPLGGANAIFRVTKDKQPLACSSTHALALPDRLPPGEAVYEVNVPVTCLIDVKGRYNIEASVAMGDGTREATLGELGVEVTSDPLLYLPQNQPRGDGQTESFS